LIPKIKTQNQPVIGKRLITGQYWFKQYKTDEKVPQKSIPKEKTNSKAWQIWPIETGILRQNIFHL
jgi:hypothetical protein